MLKLEESVLKNGIKIKSRRHGNMFLANCMLNIAPPPALVPVAVTPRRLFPPAFSTCVEVPQRGESSSPLPCMIPQLVHGPRLAAERISDLKRRRRARL